MTTTRIVLLFAALQFIPTVLSADLLTFSDGDTFDGDQATLLFDSSDQAGPFGDTNITLRTLLINGVVASAEGNLLETTGGKLGIDSASAGGGEKNNWDDGESWTYEFDQATLFDAISFGGFSSGEIFSVQSNSFIGFSPVGILGAGVSFNSVSGIWTFDGSGSNDDIVLSDLGGVAAQVDAFDAITISYSGSSSSTLQGISASAAVPEPNSLCLFLTVAFVGTSVRRRRSVTNC